MFPKVTTTAIDSFSKTYKGSSEERDDILREYEARDGDFDAIMECIMLAEDDDEDRIMSIIDEAIQSGEISSKKAYESHKKNISKRKSSRGKKANNSSAVADVTISSKKNKKVKADDTENNSSLEAMILNRQKSSGDMLAKLMAKYGGEDEPMDDIPDEQFEATRARLGSSKGSGRSTAKPCKSKGGKR